MRQSIQFGFIISLSTSALGCQRADVDRASGCGPVSESVYVNERYPASIEPFDRNAARVFTFEEGFADTVSVFVDDALVAKRYLQTESNGLAGRIEVNARANAQITLVATTDCARFGLRDGYKYLYIRKRGWAVAYSNFSRGYF